MSIQKTPRKSYQKAVRTQQKTKLYLLSTEMNIDGHIKLIFYSPGNEHEEGVVAIAALPVDAGQGLRGDGGGLAPEKHYVS